MAIEQRAQVSLSGIVIKPENFHPNAMREIVAYAASSNTQQPGETREIIIKRGPDEILVASSEMLEAIMHLPTEERLDAINEVAKDCSSAKAIVLKVS